MKTDQKYKNILEMQAVFTKLTIARDLFYAKDSQVQAKVLQGKYQMLLQMLEKVMFYYTDLFAYEYDFETGGVWHAEWFVLTKDLYMPAEEFQEKLETGVITWNEQIQFVSDVIDTMFEKIHTNTWLLQQQALDTKRRALEGVLTFGLIKMKDLMKEAATISVDCSKDSMES